MADDLGFNPHDDLGFEPYADLGFVGSGGKPKQGNPAAQLLRKQGLSAAPIPKIPLNPITNPLARAGISEEMKNKFVREGTREAGEDLGGTIGVATMALPGAGPMANILKGAAGGAGMVAGRTAVGDTPTLGEAALTVGLGAAVPAAFEAPGMIGRLTKPNARVGGVRVFKPTPSDPEFAVATPEALGAIQKANKGEAPLGFTERKYNIDMPGAPVEGQLRFIDAANKAIDEHQAVLQTWIDRAKQRGVKIPGDEIVAHVRDAIPVKMWETDPFSAQTIVNNAQEAWGGKAFAPDHFRQILIDSNAGLGPFYAKTASAQAAAQARATVPGIEKAETEKIRELLYRYLDPENNGSNIRTIQQKTGEIIHIRDQALKRNNAILAEQAMTPLEAIGNKLGKVAGYIPGSGLFSAANKAGGAVTGLSYSKGQMGRSMPMLKQAFRGAKEPYALPLPETPLYPMGNPQLQLPPAPGVSITPPPAVNPLAGDTSGISGPSFRGVPYLGQRALPPAPTIREMPGIPIPKTQGVSGPSTGPGPALSHDVGARAIEGTTEQQMPGFAVQDVVPVTDPITGETVYVAPWTQQNPAGIPPPKAPAPPERAPQVNMRPENPESSWKQSSIGRLPWEEKRRILAEQYPDFAALSRDDQNRLISQITPGNPAMMGGGSNA